MAWQRWWKTIVNHRALMRWFLNASMWRYIAKVLNTFSVLAHPQMWRTGSHDQWKWHVMIGWKRKMVIEEQNKITNPGKDWPSPCKPAEIPCSDPTPYAAPSPGDVCSSLARRWPPCSSRRGSCSPASHLEAEEAQKRKRFRRREEANRLFLVTTLKQACICFWTCSVSQTLGWYTMKYVECVTLPL